MAKFPFMTIFSGLIIAALLAGCAAPAQESSAGTASERDVTDPWPSCCPAPAEESSAARAGDDVTDPWSSWDGYGTVFLSPDAITPESPSDFVGVSFAEIENRETYDKRVGDWVTNDSWIFTATYRCALLSVDVIVNPEFSKAQAFEEALRAAEVLGRIPVGSRTAVREIWIHDGDDVAGGGNNAIELYSGYITKEFDWIEEVFIHEGAHASLDYDFGGVVNKKRWEAAVESDGQFISQYAADNPDREDIAESYGAFLIWALHRDEGLFPESAAQIEALIPARLQYFESLGPGYGPLPTSCRQ